MKEQRNTPRPTMSDEEMVKDYPRLAREYTLLHQDYREAIRKPLNIHGVTTHTFRFSGIRNARKFVREIQAIDRESAIADFELTYPDLTWRTSTELD